MLGRLILLFTIVPLAELFILIKIGSHIGALNTILLVIMTAILGAFLARLEGLRTLQQIQSSLSQGQIPAEEMIDGVLIFVGGVLLLTPGVLTDLFALVLLFPYTRTHFKRWLRRRFDRMVASGDVRLHYHRGDPRGF
ncbi:MAG: FxsA family protein [Deltaproteobacteria bacterium]|nr:FxsA family protein [Deltaproteobacteria bacterium]